MPKALFTDEKYKAVSTDAKMLYGLLLDRMHLSVKNGWVDKQRRVYQFFTVKEAQEKLGFGHEKICKLFSELERADLIVRKRQGQGKPSLIYIKKFWFLFFEFLEVRLSEAIKTKAVRRLLSEKRINGG